jgi:phosphoenolpyruvate carboxykinase (GTP)
MPRYQDMNWQGLDFDETRFNSIMTVDRAAGEHEAEAQRELFDSFGDRLPAELEAQRQALLASFAGAPAIWHAAE